MKKRWPFGWLAERPFLKIGRRALKTLEPLAAEFLNWFLMPSLQRNILYELMSDLAAMDAECGDLPPYAQARQSCGDMALQEVDVALGHDE